MRHADAMRVVEAIQAELERSGGGAAVAVTDTHGELVAFVRTDGCPLPSIGNAMNKAYTASRERITSEELGRRSREEGFPMTNFGDIRYTGWGGGVPIIRGGRTIGAVGVSGLPEAEDVVLARMGAELVSD